MHQTGFTGIKGFFFHQEPVNAVNLNRTQIKSTEMKTKIAGAVLLIVILMDACTSGGNLMYFKIAGFTQGTSYHITYAVNDSINYQPEIDSLLHSFDLSLSTYIPNSMISKINRNEDLTVDEKIKKVVEVSKEVNKASDGAFDITVLPLVNAWGFGPGAKADVDSSMIDSLLQYVGMDKIRIEGNKLIKTDPHVTIDDNALAQGYSVDLVAKFLEDRGVKNYMVEIGGELRTRGLNPKDEIWKIGIDRPDFGNMIPGAELQAIVKLEDKSLATSGNYRKYYEKNGVKYTHSIDPKTGYPAARQILSATIVADDCITADAYATACMVLGMEKAKAMLKEHPELEAYLIYNDDQGKYQVFDTKGFKPMVVKEE